MLHYQYTEHDVIFTLPYHGDQLYLVGTFSNWQKQGAFKFNKAGPHYVLRKAREELNKIGNSGYIEYCLWGDDESQPLPFNKEYPVGYYFNSQSFDSQGNYGCNYLLLPENISQTELTQIAEDSQRSFKVKQSASEFSSEYTLANFRQVEGGKIAEGNLFRSYHPLVPSRSEHVALCDIEVERQGVAMKLLEQHGVRTVINLSETSQQLASYIRSAPASYYKTLWLEQQVVNVPVAYETVYFMSDRDESFNAEELGFQSGIQAVIRYIADNPGPYHVHCRLGSDRTGVIVGFLQLLMGADKAQIMQNYLQTNEMAIGEYRSFRLLEQALCRALGEDCFDNDVVAKRYLPSLGLSGAVIDRACRNLACNA
ncbi:tyrosine-protein phosphatase [Photobacterium sp. OFAV2-7]|uniref:tyrosine-protein phosphatase n=1 Tax=Photobacterium sp. OFAV2-7 TaxID=2917748 RepID=UPI001EF5C8C3|nr:tyrosine-protein phosphatase [Photobacterium sp. OFAV2-7]MCG7585853.1 tyrosine-protein phosphatase [Photobacterium sp. OFAV2-7]